MKFWKAPILAMAVLLAAPPASAADVEWHGYFQTLHGAGTSETRGLDGQWLASREKLQLAITARAGDQMQPTIIGDYVAYDDSSAGNWDVYLYDVTTGQTLQVTDLDPDPEPAGVAPERSDHY